MCPRIAAATINSMQTTVYEIADRVYRLSTCVPEVAPGGFTFNQYLLDGDEPLLFHTGPRRMFPLVAEAVGEGAPGRPAALGQLRPRRGRRVRRDERSGWPPRRRPRCCSTRWAARCRWTTSPTARRCPSPTTAARDIGGHRVRTIVTPHVPHGWEAQVMYDEATGTLLCGDLFTRTGDGAALVHDADLVEPALAADDLFGATCLTPSTAPALRASGRPVAPYAGAHARSGVRGRRRRCAARARRRLRGAVHRRGPGLMITTAEIGPITRPEARELAEDETAAMVALLGDLSPEEWAQRTDCPAWDVRAMAGHVLGMTEGFTGLRRMAGMFRAGGKLAGGGPIDRRRHGLPGRDERAPDHR